MSETERPIDALFALRDVGVGGWSLDALDARFERELRTLIDPEPRHLRLPGRRVWRTGAGRVALALGALVPIVVVVVAIAALHRGTHAPATGRPGGRIVVRPAPPQLVKGRSGQSGVRILLTGEGIGAIKFGAAPTRLRGRFDPLLGRPTDFPYSTTDDCGIGLELVWPIVINPANGRLERSEELELFFSHGRFVGYQYGGNVLPKRGSSQRLRLRATTARGLAIGDSLRAGQRLYGRAFRISSAQNGTWQVHTRHGTLRGYANGTPKHGDVSPASLVASIDGGDVGCPALSP